MWRNWVAEHKTTRCYGQASSFHTETSSSELKMEDRYWYCSSSLFADFTSWFFLKLIFFSSKVIVPHQVMFRKSMIN